MQYTCYKPPEMFIALHRIVGNTASKTLYAAVQQAIPDETKEVREAMDKWLSRVSPNTAVRAWFTELEELAKTCTKELQIKASVQQLEKHAAELGYKLTKL